ncbi:MAG: ferrochelatase [Porticoccus sp.]|jgi:ferrochelatase|nr:ferrochelatase [Porticoccus sp.]
MKKTAIILVNLGTPETPSPKGVSNFLKLFLADRRVVELPKLIWWPILRLIVIPLRAKKVARAYQEIWWEGCNAKQCDKFEKDKCQGSPIRVITARQVKLLYKELQFRHSTMAPLVVSAVTYGAPSIKAVLDNLRSKNIEKFIILPMYPQYSGSTTGAIYDQISNIIKESRDVPDISIVKSYSTHSGYIDSLANKIKNHWDKYGKNEKLLMSFHGIPQEYTDKGDPYGSHCLSTAEALAEKLSLKDTEWSMGFQSRFGPKKWLQPYIDDQLNDCIKEGIKSIDIISPAFTADCLETLEELNIGYRELFLSAGGENYSYIPCVNDSSLFIKALADIIDTRLY